MNSQIYELNINQIQLNTLDACNSLIPVTENGLNIFESNVSSFDCRFLLRIQWFIDHSVSSKLERFNNFRFPFGMWSWGKCNKWVYVSKWYQPRRQRLWSVLRDLPYNCPGQGKCRQMKNEYTLLLLWNEIY